MNLFSEKKEEIKNYKAPQNAFLPKTVRIPLRCDFNTVCQPLVKAGDKVSEGQVIAASKDDETSVIHSSIPGMVTDILSLQCPNGKTEKVIEIALAGSFDYLGKVSRRKNMQLLSPEEIEASLLKSGIINTFDTRKPLLLINQIKNFKGRNLVIRLFDEDPSCIADRLISKFYLSEIIEGSLLLTKLLKNQNILFILNSKLLPLSDFESKKNDLMFFYDVNDSLYPMSVQAKIISTFNKCEKFKDSGINLSKKDLYCDSQTILQLYQNLLYSTPELTHLVHISGNCLKASAMLNVRNGITISELLSQIGGLDKKPGQIIINGSIRGFTADSLNTPITKYVKSVSVIKESSPSDSKIYNCIHCGNCRSICKENILPDFIYNQAVNFNLLERPGDEKDFDNTFFIKEMLKHCTNCFECNIVCPARLPLSQIIKNLKDDFNV